MSCVEMAGSASGVEARESSTAITSYRSRLAGWMFPRIAEPYVRIAMTRYTGAEDRSGSTISV